MSKDLITAIKFDNDIDSVQRRGVRATRKVATILIRKAVDAWKRGRVPKLQGILVGELEELLTDAMLVGHMRGYLMSENVYKREVVNASAFDATIRFLRRKSQIKVKALRDSYAGRVLQVLTGASQRIENTLQDTVRELIESGSTVRVARAVLKDTFDSLGLTPSSSHQLETIFRTQSATAYSAGRWEYDTDADIVDIHWGYKYVTVGDDRVRPEHAVLEGTTLPKDDPFWNTAFPPNGWNCRCQAISLYEPRKTSAPPKNFTIDDDFQFNPGKVLQEEFE